MDKPATKPDLDAIEARQHYARADEAAAIDPEVDGYYCAECMTWYCAVLNEGCDWTNGETVCDACAVTREAQATVDVCDLIAYARELEAERDHYRALWDVVNFPGIAGPPSADLDVEFDESAPVRVQLRARMLRVLIWHFAMLAKENPAPNYLSLGYHFPATLDADNLAEVDLLPEMTALAGWKIEIAAVKPGGKGPAELRHEVAAERDALLLERTGMTAAEWAEEASNHAEFTRAKIDAAAAEAGVERSAWVRGVVERALRT